jgi:hypothetical protein
MKDQYASGKYRKALNELKATCIMSRKRPKPEAHQAHQVPLWMQEAILPEGAWLGSRRCMVRIKKVLPWGQEGELLG